ncbi:MULTISPECIES: polyprenyl synthetase family protein [unclassified Kitasatospora]|uniref:polyprenyl synthetase family protein n=1 Tax=unclassified Kitasatospora TaxID=2633591 RepID=UPI00070A4AC2|nr:MULTISPECIES: polyprenyl synthetase family protein [unclassified Kitasatospora]KQV04766.1 polyprenyl synthetase [Kitasatospora sp. Root107]KRB61122.1 polyprenyl synthetase [Kitasatospora sp. Root187]
MITAALRRAAEHQRRFDARFATYFDTLTDPAGGALDGPQHGRFPARALDLLRDMSLRGGKRLRVTVLHEAAALITDQPVPGLEEAAISIELLQTHGLIHDDIIDGSAVRRGAPSVPHAYRDEYPDRPDTALGLAVLAGDLAAFLSLRVLVASDLPPDLAAAMAAELADVGATTVIGQFLDLERDFGPVPDLDFLHAVTEFKTARYSILAPLRLGLLAAGVDPAPYDRELRCYATALGIANMLRDDWLDLFGDPAVVGKSLGSDLRSGRRSYVVRALLAADTDESERKIVDTALGDPQGDDDTLDRVRSIARRHGIDRAVQADAYRYAREASTLAGSWRTRWRADAVTFFEHMPTWTADRDH